MGYVKNFFYCNTR